MKLEIKNGCFSYQSVKILDNVNMEISSGKILAVLGPNGVGKTTLLRCMMGLLKWKSGATYLNGRPITKLKSRELWKEISYVPQAKNSVLPYTVEEMVLLGRNAYIGFASSPGKEDYQKAKEALELVDIIHLKDKKCNEISGGELQMVLIARALCTESKLIVLDEPESNLDFKNQLIILNVLKKMAREYNIACIFNTHYPAHGLNIADYVLGISRDYGSVFGDVSEIINEEYLRKIFDVEVAINHFSHHGQDYNTVTAIK
jgi:iron complex transport system ATP-binding protein